ncbi:hypothetical protein CLV63_112111 [Murinocardiopsis flavida]|uniref:PE-PGRS family protein n=1 Tax=Murinocardiopsis flavida TaxID=645275 RepID=A0A2P8DGA5_9ACTN|nr:DUF5954 family protein [Murinocardiopsis flavida]PSK96229.1 hypothetical protein CLV63_112111 [Murinocardiopsis flavida]
MDPAHTLTCPHCSWSIPAAGPGDPFSELVRELHLQNMHPGTTESAHPAPADARAGTTASEYRGDLAILYPRFQPARESGGRWVACGPAGTSPQDGRDCLASFFLKQCAEEQEDERRREYGEAAHLLDWEAHDELVVLGQRYRIVRIERYVPLIDGVPEPPRSSDSTAARGPDATHTAGGEDLSIHAPAGADDAALTAMLRRLVPAGGPVPAEVTEDALVRNETHPDLIRLRPGFELLTREAETGWRPVGEEHSTPAAARNALRAHLEARSCDDDWNTAPVREREACARALAHYEKATPDTVTVLDRDYRLVRVIRVVRQGFDGLESPRESDFDPYLPPAAQYEQDADQGLLRPDDDAPPSRPGKDTARFIPGAQNGR